MIYGVDGVFGPLPLGFFVEGIFEDGLDEPMNGEGLRPPIPLEEGVFDEFGYGFVPLEGVLCDLFEPFTPLSGCLLHKRFRDLVRIEEGTGPKQIGCRSTTLLYALKSQFPGGCYWIYMAPGLVAPLPKQSCAGLAIPPIELQILTHGTFCLMNISSSLIQGQRETPDQSRDLASRLLIYL